MRKALTKEISRTGVAPMQLLKNLTDIPDGLTGLLIDNWLDFKESRLEPLHYDFTLRQFETLPKAVKSINRIRPELTNEQYTPQMRQAIKEERKRTHISVEGILETMWRSGIDRHELDAQTIRAWHYPHTKKINVKSYKSVMYAYKQQPTYYKEDAVRGGYITLTNEMVNALQTEFKRTGIAGTKLIQLSKGQLADVSHSVINSIRKGEINTVNENTYNTALKTWKNLPDKPVKDVGEYISIHDLSRLRAMTILTGVRVDDLVIKRQHDVDYPKGLTHTKALQIIKGEKKSTPSGWIKFIFKAYDKEPHICKVNQRVINTLSEILKNN